MTRRHFFLLFVIGAAGLELGCGEVETSVDAGRDGGRLFCARVEGIVDASEAAPPAIYECTRAQDKCFHGPNGDFICCDPDSGLTCYP
ncbi:hypothetical protein BH09MYX1_BH09MYX1_63460 [soil metagenome]